MARSPSLLLILTTQWRGRSCGFLGDRHGLTPGLDRLAEEGEVFTKAVTPHPFGPFARAALLTGVPSPENGVKDYFDPLPPARRTLAHLLNAKGYSTAFFGKWHLAPRDPVAPLVGDAHARQEVPVDYRGGFSHWEGFESGFLLNDPWLQGDGIGAPSPFSGYQSEVLAARTRAWWFARDRAKPAFALTSLEAPHPPYDAAVPVDTPPVAEVTLAPNVPADPAVREKAAKELAGYHRHIRATDTVLEKLVREVRAEDPETLIVISSVHGDMHGAHGLFRKGWPYQESVGVPLLVLWPESWKLLGRRPEAVSLLDLWQLFDLASEGRAWRPEPGRTVSLSMPSVVCLPHQCDRVWSGTFDGNRKRIMGPDGRLWLDFQLESDPWEMKNLRAE